MWNPILITDSTFRVILIMQDELCILGFLTNPTEELLNSDFPLVNDSGRIYVDLNPPQYLQDGLYLLGDLIQNVQEIKKGWVSPVGTIVHFRNYIQQDIYTALHDRTNRYTLYITVRGNRCNVLGWDGNMYDTIEGSLQERNPILADYPKTTISMVSSEYSYYSIFGDEPNQTNIMMFDRMGKPSLQGGQLIKTFGTGEISRVVGFEQIYLPLNLIPQGQSIPMTVSPSISVAEKRLNQLIGRRLPLRDYWSDSTIRIYFVLEDSDRHSLSGVGSDRLRPVVRPGNSTPYKSVNNGFVSLTDPDNILEELPPGDVIFISYDPQEYQEVVLLIKPPNVALFGLQGDQIRFIDDEPADIQGASEVWSLENSGLLFQEIQHQIREESNLNLDGQSLSRLIRERNPPLSKNQKDSIVSISLDQLLTQLYNLPGTEPNTLEDYSRVSFEEISDLTTRGEIVRYEINPLYQPFAGPPGTRNRIVSFQVIDGRKIFAKVVFDPQTNQMGPSV